MTPDEAAARAVTSFDSGEFQNILAGRVAKPTESQDPERAPAMKEYQLFAGPGAEPRFGEKSNRRTEARHPPRARLATSSGGAPKVSLLAAELPAKPGCAP